MKFLLLLCLSLNLIAAEADPSVSDADKKAAAQRADDLIKELEATRLSVDPASKKDLDQIDLLTRKAEAYVLVEQPVDAGRMLSQAQALIAKYQEDKRSDLRRALKSYEKRLVVVAQAVLTYTATLDLDDKKKDQETQDPAPEKNTKKDVSEDSKKP